MQRNRTCPCTARAARTIQTVLAVDSWTYKPDTHAHALRPRLGLRETGDFPHPH